MTTAMTKAQRRRTVSRRVDTERVRHGIAKILGIPVSDVWPKRGDMR